MAAAMFQGAMLYFPVDMLCCAGGLKNILYSFGLGYGLSMSVNGGLILWQHSSGLRQALTSHSTSAWLAVYGGGLFVAYGVRLVSFLLRRHRSSSYSPKFKEVQEKSDNMASALKLSISAFVALSQSLYCMPLQLACAAGVHGDSAPISAWLALGLSTVGLAIETVADEQKMAAKHKRPTEPVTTGLFSVCRHPNYSGEILFHCGVWGLCAHAPVAQQGLAMLAPGFMIWCMSRASLKLDRSAAEKYEKDTKYIDWVAKTACLFPYIY